MHGVGFWWIQEHFEPKPLGISVNALKGNVLWYVYFVAYMYMYVPVIPRAYFQEV